MPTVIKCQSCGNPIEPPRTLCDTCRHEYAKTLHTLRRSMHLLQALANRKYKLTNPQPGHTHPTEAPTPINLGLLDKIDQIEDALQDAWFDTGAPWTDRWQRLIPRMQTHLSQLCQAPHAGQHLRQLTRLSQQAAQLTDRTPKTRRIIGICPQCGREITAAPTETLRLCKCGWIADIPAMREQTAQTIDRYHKTLTPTGCSQWLHDDYGLTIPPMTIKNWLRRNKLPTARPIEDGYWEFSIRETVAMALATSKRQ